MRTDLFDYFLPPELIAQTPLPRGELRLLVLHRANGHIEHRRFPDLLAYLNAGDTLVVNDTRVIARRLRGLRPSGHEAEVLLLRPVGERQWAALVKPGRSLREGVNLTLVGPEVDETQSGVAQETARIVGETEEGGRLLEFADAAARDRVGLWGSSPLPPYIHTPLPTAAEERYQTVYARHNGSAAAPTAGLHFTDAMLNQAQAQGIQYRPRHPARRRGHISPRQDRRYQHASDARRMGYGFRRSGADYQRHTGSHHCSRNHQRSRP